jgi:flagellar motility protein MotE (MotC chaperone)
MLSTTDKMSSYNKERFSTGKIVCLSNDQGLRYYASTIQTCDDYLKGVRRSFASYKKNQTTYKKCFQVLKGTGVKAEVVQVVPCDCLEKLKDVLNTFIDNNECINDIDGLEEKRKIKEMKEQARLEKIRKEREFIKKINDPERKAKIEAQKKAFLKSIGQEYIPIHYEEYHY